jgi:hypothetical protein
MPRRSRIKLAGIPQHIVQRGINREPCFFADEDYHVCKYDNERPDPGLLVPIPTSVGDMLARVAMGAICLTWL